MKSASPEDIRPVKTIITQAITESTCATVLSTEATMRWGMPKIHWTRGRQLAIRSGVSI